LSLFAPARRRGHEILDDAGVDADTRIISIGDVTRSNVLFGGRRAALAAIDHVLTPQANLTLLDVGTGLGDIPAAIAARARSHGATIRTIGLDEACDLLVAAKARLDATTCGNAATLPFRDRSIDIVTCSQLLHHFEDGHLEAIVRELDRVARKRVVIADLRRSRVAAAGFWLASFPLGFHRVTRHDGVVSVFRGFVASELRDVVQRATGVTPTVRHHLGFRLTASWMPTSKP
jgi:ubiquinone/menaquinone biosynthesis C-methylase UbiE